MAELTPTTGRWSWTIPAVLVLGVAIAILSWEPALSWLRVRGTAIQAVATTVLVGVTAIYAVLTRRAVSAAERSAAASEDAAKAAKDSSTAAQRTLVLTGIPYIMPRLPKREGEKWTVELSNHGRTPALNLRVTVRTTDGEAHSTLLSVLPPGENYTKSVPARIEIEDAAKGTVIVTYHDMAGRRLMSSRDIKIGAVLAMHENEAWTALVGELPSGWSTDPYLIPHMPTVSG